MIIYLHRYFINFVYNVYELNIISFKSVHDDNTVRAYVDCRWLRTDILEKDALDTPRDADLIIGYLFSVRLYSHYHSCK